MSDENKKSASNADAEEKPETVEKKAKASKKTKEKTTDDSGNKTNIIKKLQAMGVMSGNESGAKGNSESESNGHLKIAVAVFVSIAIVGSFVWALNKEAAEQQVASDTHNHTVPSAPHLGAWQASSANSQSRNSRYPAYNYEEQQKRIKLQREQQNKWMQKQRQAQEEQRAQQQKWNQQQQQNQAQQRTQQQKWAQQQPTPEQYRAQQQQWAEQHRQAQEQQRAQQQKWAEQQRQAQIQQRAQQQKWAQQQPVQSQPRYAYPPNTGYQGQSMPPSYNYAPGNQQPGPYYNGRQY